jgi:subtilisin family serine protease
MTEKIESWLVGPLRRSSLVDLMQRFNDDPDAKIERILGSPDNPSVLVVSMGEATAKRYQQEFQAICQIERNAPLHPLDSLGSSGEVEMSEDIEAKSVSPDRRGSRVSELNERLGRSSTGSSVGLAPQSARPTKRRVAPAAAGPGPNVGGDNVTGATIPVRRQSFLIGHARGLLPAGVQPLNLQLMAQGLGGIEGIEITNVLPVPPTLSKLGLMSAVPTQSEQIIVAEMPDAKAEMLRKQPQLVVESNLPLRLPEMPIPEPSMRHPSVLWPLAAAFSLQVRVQNEAGQPLGGAEVFFFGRTQSGGITDNNGLAKVTLFGETPTTITSVYVKPKADYWERFIRNPVLTPNGTFDVALKPLGSQFPNFPNQEQTGWGLAAMKVDQLPVGQFTGAGIKIGIVDSGAAKTHHQLQAQVQKGFDIVANSPDGWDNDTVMHGTHCAGVIAAQADGEGIRGIAPGAKLFIYKIFPGGQFDHLIQALDRCIEDDVDVVNLSLGADQPSLFVEERLRAARNQGIACIVAAGNSSGPVQFPASSSNVLAISAIGKAGQFPPDTYHSTQMFAAPDASGYFSAKFSCFGPQIGVCAPGVAILSSVPSDGYAAWDGTSMAGPHVTGLAALVLAHHPDFQKEPYNQKNAQRVDRLFRILKETSQAMNLGAGRTGAGLPDAQRALTVELGSDQGGGNGAGASQGSALSRLLERLGKSGAAGGVAVAANEVGLAPAAGKPQANEAATQAIIDEMAK